MKKCEARLCVSLCLADLCICICIVSLYLKKPKMVYKVLYVQRIVIYGEVYSAPVLS
jgi:hypothetical protein